MTLMLPLFWLMEQSNWVEIVIPSCFRSSRLVKDANGIEEFVEFRSRHVLLHGTQQYEPSEHVNPAWGEPSRLGSLLGLEAVSFT